MIRANLAVVRRKGLGPNTHLCNNGMIVLRRIPTRKIDDFEATPYKKKLWTCICPDSMFRGESASKKINSEVLTLHTLYSGAVVSGGAPLVDPRL